MRLCEGDEIFPWVVRDLDQTKNECRREFAQQNLVDLLDLQIFDDLFEDGNIENREAR